MQASSPELPWGCRVNQTGHLNLRQTHREIGEASSKTVPLGAPLLEGSGPENMGLCLNCSNLIQTKTTDELQDTSPKNRPSEVPCRNEPRHEPVKSFEIGALSATGEELRRLQAESLSTTAAATNWYMLVPSSLLCCSTAFFIDRGSRSRS